MNLRKPNEYIYASLPNDTLFLNEYHYHLNYNKDNYNVSQTIEVPIM